MSKDTTVTLKQVYSCPFCSYHALKQEKMRQHVLDCEDAVDKVEFES